MRIVATNGRPALKSRSGAPSVRDGYNMSKRKTKTYDMKFVPLDEKGMRKKGCPYVGASRGYENGQIVSLPLEKRWETWWELVDNKVPQTELDRDQKIRDAFLVEAEKTAAIRAKELEVDEARTRGGRKV